MNFFGQYVRARPGPLATVENPKSRSIEQFSGHKQGIAKSKDPPFEKEVSPSIGETIRPTEGRDRDDLTFEKKADKIFCLLR